MADGEYTYSIEKIFIKAVKRDEIRFSLYKDTRRILSRLQDVTKKQLLELIKKSIAGGAFSKNFVKSLGELLNSK